MADYARAWVSRITAGAEVDSLILTAQNLSLGIENVRAALPASIQRTADILSYLTDKHQLLTVGILPFTAVAYAQIQGAGGSGLHNDLLGIQRLGTGTGYYHLTEQDATALQQLFTPSTSLDNIPTLDPLATNNIPGRVVKQLLAIDGNYYLFTAKVAGGPFPAPTTSDSTQDWQAVAAPMPATAKYQQLPLAVAQSLRADYNLDPQRLYAIVLPFNPSLGPRTAYVVALRNNLFAPLGFLQQGGQVTVVNADVPAGNFTPLGGTSLSNATPLPNGTATPGMAQDASRSDHVHDKDPDIAANTAALAGKENVSNKAADLSATGSSSTAKYPSVAAVKTGLASKQDSLGFTPENAASKGVANGYAPLDGSSKVPAINLPSYVDDVNDDYATLTALQAGLPVGEKGKIYVVTDSGRQYRWNPGTSAYIRIVASPGSTDELAEGSMNLYFGEPRVLATVLANLTPATGAITATDSILAALNKVTGFIAGIAGTVRSTVLSGLSLVTNTAITATDTVLGALGKLQAQITALPAPPTAGTGPGNFTPGNAALLKVNNLSDLPNTATANQNLGTAFNQHVPKAADFTIVAADRGKVFEVTTGTSNVTGTLPTLGTTDNGFIVFLRKADTGTGLVVVLGYGIAKQGHTIEMEWDGANWLNRSFAGVLDANGNYQLSAQLNLLGGLKIGSTGAVVTITRDGTTIKDNAAVVAAVTNANNTWNTYNELTAYNDAGRLAAGAPSDSGAGTLVGSADVKPGDTFTGIITSSAWDFFYKRRVDGTLGWCRRVC